MGGWKARGRSLFKGGRSPRKQVPGNYRSHMCQALFPVPGARRSPGGSVPTCLQQRAGGVGEAEPSLPPCHLEEEGV